MKSGDLRRFSVCVYCGSRSGRLPAYVEAAAALGRALAEQNWRLVYGAGDVGLMGAVAQAAQDAGGDTFGVIPMHLVEAEQGRRDLGRMIVTETMHERKKVMFMNSDAVVLAPGGAGSLDEFFEVLTWAHLKLHVKPILLLDTEGYWQPLLRLIEHSVTEGFLDADLAARVIPCTDARTVIDRLRPLASA